MRRTRSGPCRTPRTARRAAASGPRRPDGGPSGRAMAARERAPGTGGRRRRVVIDSQASRRQAPAPLPQQRRRRSRGRGAPPPEPGERPPTVVVEPPTLKIPSGATVRDVAEHLGVQVSEVIKKLMSMGEMASITQTLSDEAIAIIADEFDKKVEVVRAAEE